MKVIFVTNVPSPYRVDFFNELGKYCELTVLFERHSASDRNSSWKNESTRNYTEVFCDLKPVGTDRSKGRDLIKQIKRINFDEIIISGYSSPAVMLLINYCKIHRIPYYIESDGGFNRKDNLLKGIIKKYLLNKAKGHFTTCKEHLNYLKSIGVKGPINIFPFSSIKNSDIIDKPLNKSEKLVLRDDLGIKEDKMLISVGQFIHRKGYDVLLKAVSNIPNDIGVYIIGGKPTQEYIDLKDKLNLSNVHFVDFMNKSDLFKWYQAADCFVLPTREDVWGLVINEAMANALPVITTNRCMSGVEIIDDYECGFVVPIENFEILAEKINYIFASYDIIYKMSENSLRKISNWTIENMAKYHIDVLENNKK